MKSMKPDEFLKAHINLQLGTYFNKDEALESGCRFVSSAKITDYYWNYAYNLICDMNELPRCIQEIREYATDIKRVPAIYITPDTSPPNLDDIITYKEKVSEVWMQCLKGDLESTNSTDLIIKSVESKTDFEQFLFVFSNAYGSEEPGGLGYSDLPKEYPESLSNSSPASGVRIKHFTGYESGKPVAIASVYIHNSYAGLYNVGCIHSARRKGYGSYVSIKAMTEAFEIGCENVFLQTEPDSAVEQLYKNIGFKRCFMGHTLLLS